LINQLDINIWDRQFSLPFEYDCYDGEAVTTEQVSAWEKFLAHPKWIDEAKAIVEAHCKEAVSEDENNQKKDNIFSYVKPVSFFITREKAGARVAMICNYRYDPEHGLAIVFSHNGEIKVDNQDML